MSFSLRALCVVAVLLSAARLPADEVDDYVEAQRREQNIPGISLLVVDQGKVVK